MDLVTLPFQVKLRTRFRGVTERSGVLVKGPKGWAEFSPFPEYDDRMAHRWWRAAHEFATTALPAPIRDLIPVNTTVPAVSPEEANEMVLASGCSTAKVKVGEGDDEARVEAVRDALGPNGNIRLDVNGSWDAEQAIRSITRLSTYDIQYVEQPCERLDDLARVRKAVDVPIAADESIRLAEDPMTVQLGEAADIAILKVQPLGGVLACLAIAERLGLPVVVSSALETSVGIAMGARLAACLPELPYACGLGTVPLLERDVVAEPLTPIDGHIEVREVEVAPDLMDEPDDAEGLLARFDRAREAQ